MDPKILVARKEQFFLISIVIFGVLSLYYGWKQFWFLTDDAFIAFRYISNAQIGYGYVWNPPPFLPVEGYTSFSWVVLLDGVWRIFGIEPPDSANNISLMFSLGVLLLGAMMIVQLKWHSGLAKYKLVFVLLFVIFMTYNRTFLAWSSSGLETSLMNFLLILWVYLFIYHASSLTCRTIGALVAAALALTRPEGLLYCVATMAIIVLLAVNETEEERKRKTLFYGLLPFTVVLLHQIWRLGFYGEWFPNTYYAKVSGVWPESGIRYLISFTLEYAIWFSLIFIIFGFFKLLIDSKQMLFDNSRSGHDSHSQKTLRSSIYMVFVIGTLLLHAGYYTLVVGGDHFEYRVYSYLLPLIFILFIWSLNHLCIQVPMALGATILFVLLSMPVQWTHWFLTKDLNTREETHVMTVDVAPHWPWAFQWYASAFDELQSWLIRHHVCMRHQEHKIFWKTQISQNPFRQEEQQISADNFPVFVSLTVGVPSWVMPSVFVIDAFGLNDYVIARTEPPENIERLMAHGRYPPDGYIESFLPNVIVREKEIIHFQRKKPVTEEYIRENEKYWMQYISRQN